MCVILSYIALGACVFATYQGWSYVDGLFFSFAVLGTIGLIDIPTSYSASSSSEGAKPSLSTVSNLQNSATNLNNKIDQTGYSESKQAGDLEKSDVQSTLLRISSEALDGHTAVDSLFVVLCTCYLLLGLAIISMCVQLMEHKCRDILRRLATTRLMGSHGSWMFSAYGGYGENNRMGKGRHWTTSAAESPNNSSSWQGLSRQNSRETSIDNLPRYLDTSLSRTNLQGMQNTSSTLMTNFD